MATVYSSIFDTNPMGVAGTYDGKDVRAALLGNALPGLFEIGDFAASQRAAGANMSVDIASGRAFIDPRQTLHQGVYLARRTDAVAFNTAVDGAISWPASDPSNPRIDLLCMQVFDPPEDSSGGSPGAKFVVITGTPAAGATHQLNVTNWPAIPTGVLPLQAIHRPAGSTTITTSQITNLNPIGGTGRSTYSMVDAAEATASASYARLTTPDFVCVYVPHANARVRVFSEAHWKASAASGTQGITLFLNDQQLKLRNTSNGAPAAAGFEIASLGTLFSRVASNGSINVGATTAFFSTAAGATADVTDTTTGVAGTSSTSGMGVPVEITQLAAGWYVIEQRYKTSANTLTVEKRRMWAEVIG